MFKENLQRFPQPHRFPHLPIRAPFWKLKKERESERGGGVLSFSSAQWHL